MWARARLEGSEFGERRVGPGEKLRMVPSVMSNGGGNLSEQKSAGLGPAGCPWEGHAPSLVLSLHHLYQDKVDKLMSEVSFLLCMFWFY